MSDRSIEYDSGAKTRVDAAGNIFNAGTPYYGSLDELPAEKRAGVTSIEMLTKPTLAIPPLATRCGLKTERVLVQRSGVEVARTLMTVTIQEWLSQAKKDGLAHLILDLFIGLVLLFGQT
jgi:hypothetical protein